jgi:hypothetical protein
MGHCGLRSQYDGLRTVLVKPENVIIKHRETGVVPVQVGLNVIGPAELIALQATILNPNLGGVKSVHPAGTAYDVID